MNTRILSDSDVRELLPMAECIDLMEDTLRAASEDKVIVPLRQGIRFPDGSGLLGLMPAVLKEPLASGVKVVNVMHSNHGKGYDSHLGVVLYFEGEYGELRAIIDASSVTAIRTAAASGAATRLLANKDAKTVAMFGSGVQARSHVDAMMAVRPIQQVLVSTLSPENGQAFKKRIEEKHGVKVEVCADPEAMCAEADIICTATSSKTPVLQGAWVRPGTHINAVGACFKSDRELDTSAVQQSRVFTDRLESALNEAGDIAIPLGEGAIQESHLLGEIGEVAAGSLAGRQTPQDITLYKSLGFAAEDLAAAKYLYYAAGNRNLGLEMYIGGRVEA